MVYNVKAFYFSIKIEIEKEALYYYYEGNPNGATSNFNKRLDIYTSFDEILEFYKLIKNNNFHVFDVLYKTNGIKIVYNILENLKLEKNIENLKKLEVITKEKEKKMWKYFSLHTKYCILYRKIRKKFYFLKPFVKKFWSKKYIERG